MPRIVLGIEYEGGGFCGWQWQPGRCSIQVEVEKALAKVADHPVSVAAAGRTDAGVHALEQVAHCDVAVVREERAWVLGGNTLLPDAIRILWVKPAMSDFHARYSAIARLYRYVIDNRPVRSALRGRLETWCYHPLDEGRMQQAANCLVGNHDFSSFRAQGCQSRSPFRIVHFIDVKRTGDTVTIEICANAFLHHMVRNIAGVLIAVGSGKQAVDWALSVLAAKRREMAGVTAPANGLYLAGICYPDHFGLPRHPIFQRLPENAQRFQ